MIIHSYLERTKKQTSPGCVETSMYAGGKERSKNERSESFLCCFCFLTSYSQTKRPRGGDELKPAAAVGAKL